MTKDRIWCQKCGKLIQVNEAAQVFNTVVKIFEHGIYPYGACHTHSDVKQLITS